MKRYIILILLGVLMLSACKGQILINEGVEKPKGVEFSIVDENFLKVESSDKSYYVTDETSSEIFSQVKDLAIIFKSFSEGFSIWETNPSGVGIMTRINALDIDKGLIVIGGRTYKLSEYDENIDNALDLNNLFKFMDKGTISINPDNYEEFIDDDGTVYKQGDEYKGEATFLYPLKLDGKDIYSITYNTETGKVFSIKDKTTMLMNGEEAKKIKTVSYGGIYQGEDALLVEVDGSYYILFEQASK